jgi:hypothetical protein
VEKLAARTIAVGMAALVGLIACGRVSSGGIPVVARDRGTVPTAGGAGTVEVGRWTIRVFLSRSRMGPLALRTSSVRRAPDTSSEPWIQHEVRVTNVGRRRVRLGDTRRSAYLRGPVERALLGADEGCGYGRASGSDQIDVGLCAAYLDAPTLRVGERIKRTVTLFKGLKGMKQLRAGTYVFQKKVRYNVGTPEGRTGHLKVVYKITSR